MLGITDYLWRLLPANPILLRVVETGGKRKRDLFIRCGYLGLLITLVIFSLVTSSNSVSGTSLANLAAESGKIFQRMSMLQLALVALLAPIFTAAATATVTGALAMAIATFKVGTRRTIFSFYMFVVIYLVGGFLLDRLDFFRVALLDPATGNVSSDLSKTSWLTGLHPFLSLRAIFHDRSYLPPSLAQLPESLRGWPFGWYLTSPTSFYISFMFFLSTILVLPSIVLLRRMAQST